MRRLLAALAIVAVALLPRRAAAQCYEVVDVRCPTRSEITLGVGPSTEKVAISIAATTTARFGAYVRFFPSLKSTARPVVNSVLQLQEASEYGLAYRFSIPLTLGVGYAKLTDTERTYGGTDPFTGRPTLVDEQVRETSSPTVFVAYAFHPPRKAIGFALTASAGSVGSGLSIATTLRFPKGGQTPGVP